MAYRCKTFKAWKTDPNNFQMKILDYPVILLFNFAEYAHIRRDLTTINLELSSEIDNILDFDHIRIYGIPDQEKIYILFKSNGLSVGIPDLDCDQFMYDLLNFNPECMLANPL